MDQTSGFTTEEIIAKYIELRDYKEQLQADLKVKLEPIEEAMGVLANTMLDRMNKSGEESIRTGRGTAFIKPTDFIGVADWDTSLTFIQENGLWNFLTKALNKTAVLEYMKSIEAPPGVDVETWQAPPPPGVNLSRKREVQFRRPSR